MELVSQGVVTNRHKTLNEGKVVASGAIGSQQLYRSLHNNVVIEFRPSDYVNNPAVIAQNHKMVAINFARTMDLSGQVYADALPQNHFSGVTGMFDFILGTSMCSRRQIHYCHSGQKHRWQDQPNNSKSRRGGPS